LVIGGGAAGMTAALVGALEGLKTLLCEKTSMLGGTTATSGGTIWVPGTTQSVRAGVPDTIDAARHYLNSVIGPRGGDDQREAFLQSGSKVLDYLEARSDLVFVAAQAHPDYIANHPGAAYGGRALSPVPFDGRKLGTDFDRVRPPRPEFLILGGMMVLRTDIPHLVNPFGSLKSFTHVARLILRHAADRLRYRRGTNLVMGNAIVARLLSSLRKQQVPIRFDTVLVDLVREKGRVVGAVLDGPDGRISVRARNGVVLATGGIAWNQKLRDKLFPAPARQYSLAPKSNTGDGIDIGLQAGAGFDDKLDSAGLWMPCSILRRPNGTTSVYPHIILDRSKPGLIAVNKAGRRFVNEGDSYHDFVMAMLRSNETAPCVPAHLICDRSFLIDYGVGLAYPGTRNFKPFIDAGYLIEAATLHELAAKIGVEPAGLEQTVTNHNRYAETGIDEEFGRGTSDLNRINGDPTNKPNPCMRKIGPGPYYAVAVWPADLAGSAGLRTDAYARVLGNNDQPIDGLYACGNDAGSIFRGTYPGPGTTLGPAIVFGWRAAMHAAGKLEQDDTGRAGTKLAS
jgi:succinate dehydrogenase/fumarate reductase flavoprotein subunit